MRSTNSRPYRMQRRAAQVDETHLKITEAAVRLHTTVGPSQTSIAAVAEEAGVTRLTVYRHFADLDELFVACRAHWLARQPPPDPRRWPIVTDRDTRVRQALAELYGWYRDRGDELYTIYRDNASMPLTARQARANENRQLGEALVAGFVQADGGRSLPAVARHLCDFGTWRSLAVGGGLDDREIVEIGVQLIRALVEPR